MIVTEHLCGVTVVYSPERSAKPPVQKLETDQGRPQGSLYNYQKRKVADAVEYIRRTAESRAMLFTVTTSHRWPARYRGKLLSMLIDNMRANYGLREYAWVREVGDKKPPHYSENLHYHFVADVDWFDPVALSVYWSGLFGFHCKVKNSIRLGSKPDKEGRRMFFLNSDKHAWYLSKYLGKQFKGRQKAGRKFGISAKTSVLSLPECYEAKFSFSQPPGEVLNAKGEFVPHPVSCLGVSMVNEQGMMFNKSLYQWKKIKDHNVWIGRKR